MEAKEAIMGFSQSEKIKAGLIWISNGLELLKGLPEPEKKGAEKLVSAIVNMIFQEIRLAKNLTGNGIWEEVEKPLEQATVMINSGVAPESVIHLTRALSQVTNIGHRSMSLLKENGLL